MPAHQFDDRVETIIHAVEPFVRRCRMLTDAFAQSIDAINHPLDRLNHVV